MMKRIITVFAICLFLSSSLYAQEGLPPPGLEAGTQAPDFEAQTYQGASVKLSELYKDGPVVLIFYRGGWCMYCNLQLQEYQRYLEEFESRGVMVLAVSVDKQENAAKTVEKKKLEFEVVSNPEANLLKLYNVIYQVPEDLAKKYKDEYNIDLEAASGRTDHIISVPATYVIDTTGKIVFAHADYDYTVRKDPEAILKVLDQIK